MQRPDASLLSSDSFNSIRPAYFAIPRPQYPKIAMANIISITDHGAKGDGFTDDTHAISSALAQATTTNLIYFPPGSHIITSTVVIPPHVRLTGQVWSQLVAKGSFFADISDPKPMIKVGNPGDRALSRSATSSSRLFVF